jgi:hypothetical protein
MGMIYVQITNEFYQCICGKGQIKLIKNEYGTVGLSPCPVCGSKIDSDGNYHSKFK